MIILRYKNTGRDQNEFEIKYGTFVEEFKFDQGLAFQVYYPLFLLRRLLYVISQVILINFPLAQVLSNSGCTVIIIIYLLKFRPFKELLTLLITLVSEISIAIVFLSTLFLLIYEDNENIGRIENVCIFTILASVGFQMIVGFLNFIIEMKKLYDKLLLKRAMQFMKNFKKSDNRISDLGI